LTIQMQSTSKLAEGSTPDGSRTILQVTANRSLARDPSFPEKPTF
jgi:hypothetical protein